MPTRVTQFLRNLVLTIQSYSIKHFYLNCFACLTLLILGEAHAEGQFPAIADWDAVPYQTFQSELNVGVVAFHADGIKQVDFYINQAFYKSINKPTYNPQTKVKEYWITVTPETCGCKQLNLTAKVIPTKGMDKDLQPLVLYPNPKRSYYQINEVFVSNNGSDESGKGSESNPYKTISYALSKSEEGSIVTITSAGTYVLSFLGKRPQTKFWTTIRGAPLLKKEDIVVVQPTLDLLRLKHDKIKLQNLTVDFSTIKSIYPENNQLIWFDNVKWTDSNYKVSAIDAPLNYKVNYNPVRTSRDISGYYVTDSIAENMFYGFVDARLARNIKIKNILGDALTNNKLTINAEVSNILGNETKIHSDIFQVFGRQDNLILYNLLGYQIGGSAYRASNGKVTNDGVQNIFLGTVDSELSNIAVVNVCVQNNQLPHKAPFSQLSAKQTNVLIQNVTTINQDWKMRPDLLETRKFQPDHVVIKDSHLPNLFFSGIKREETIRYTADQVSVVNTDTDFNTSEKDYCKSQKIIDTDG